MTTTTYTGEYISWDCLKPLICNNLTEHGSFEAYYFRLNEVIDAQTRTFFLKTVADFSSINNMAAKTLEPYHSKPDNSDPFRKIKYQNSYCTSRCFLCII